MTGGSITPIIIGVVLVISAHIDIAVPMVAVDICIVIEEEIVRGWLEPAAVRSFIHAVAEITLEMLIAVGDPTMGDYNWQIRGSRQIIIVGWIAMAELAVEGKVYDRVMAAKAAPPDATDTIQGHTMTEGAGLLDTARRVMECIVRPGPL